MELVTEFVKADNPVTRKEPLRPVHVVTMTCRKCLRAASYRRLSKAECDDAARKDGWRMRLLRDKRLDVLCKRCPG